SRNLKCTAEGTRVRSLLKAKTPQIPENIPTGRGLQEAEPHVVGGIDAAADDRAAEGAGFEVRRIVGRAGDDRVNCAGGAAGDGAGDVAELEFSQCGGGEQIPSEVAGGDGRDRVAAPDGAGDVAEHQLPDGSGHTEHAE